MRYKVSFVVSPAKGAMGRLFSVKGKLTEGILEIRSEKNDIHLSGVDALVRDVDRSIDFSEIRVIEGKGPEILVIQLVNGEEIQFKNVEELSRLLGDLGQHCHDVTHDRVRKRIEKYDDRVRRWGKT